MNVHAFSHLPGKVASRRVHLLLVRMPLIFTFPWEVELVLPADVQGNKQSVQRVSGCMEEAGGRQVSSMKQSEWDQNIRRALVPPAERDLCGLELGLGRRCCGGHRRGLRASVWLSLASSPHSAVQSRGVYTTNDVGLGFVSLRPRLV